MNKLALFFLLVSPLLFLQSTCSPENQPKTETPTAVSPPTTASIDCVDPAKVSDQGCPENYDPVCGCNEKTYPNACEASAKGVLKWERGVCAKDCVNPQKISQNPCPEIYDPVCGCDQKTYPNTCTARNAGLTHWTKGACSDGCIDKTKISRRPCPDVYRPVCGCDGKTYPNKCNAEIRGVTRWVNGECPGVKSSANKNDGCIDPSKISMRPCPDVYDPVCGCNGKTYPNECSAQIAGLLKYTKGACDADKDCIDQSKIKINSPCPDIYQPVCGCNGRTYNNKCTAGKAGVTSWTEGPCPKK